MAKAIVHRINPYMFAMSGYHLVDNRLSLRAKGLLSLMLYLTDNDDCAETVINEFCRENEEEINEAMDELVLLGYIKGEKTAENYSSVTVFDRPQGR